MKELQSIFQNKLEDYLKSGKIEEKIENSIEKVFDACIESAFSWGDIRKSVEGVIKEKMVVSVDAVEIQDYNQIMVESLKGQISKFTNTQALQGFTDIIVKLFGDAPKEITLTKLIEHILEEWRDDDPCSCDEQKHAEIELKENDYGGYSLNISDGEKYSSDKVSLYISQGGVILLSHKAEMNPTLLHGVNGYIFNLYAAKTKITEIDKFDEDNINTALFNEHY